MKDNIKIAKELIKIALELTSSKIASGELNVKGDEPPKKQETNNIQESDNNQQDDTVTNIINEIHSKKSNISGLGKKKIYQLIGKRNDIIGKMTLLQVLELIASIAQTKK